MTTLQKLSALEAQASEARELNLPWPECNYAELGRLHTTVRLEERAAAKAKEGAK